MNQDAKTGAKLGIAYLFLPQIIGALRQAARTVSLLAQIAFFGSVRVGERAYEVVNQNRRGILYSLLICLVGNIAFFCLGAIFHNGLLMTIGGFFLLTPFITVAVAGSAVAFLLSLYIRVLSGSLLTIHSALLEALRKAGFEPTGVPTPVIDGSVVTRKIRNIWSAIIPLGLTTIYCIVFPSWRALRLMPIVIFFLIVMAIMVDQWANISLAEDEKKLIRTARAKRRIYGLVSFGLTLLLVWGGFSIAMNNTAKALSQSGKETDQEIGQYIETKGSLISLVKGVAKDGYGVVIAQPKAEKAAREIAVRDSLRQYQQDYHFETPTKKGQAVVFLNPNRKTFYVQRGDSCTYTISAGNSEEKYTVVTPGGYYHFWVNPGMDGIKVTQDLKNANKFVVE
ncbi:hypothetical protein GYA54_02380 [Candidatus Kuenenbacteria bacterium]|nr:hypothetical protein [Candidatus Kuenenbacteria bacterium]